MRLRQKLRWILSICTILFNMIERDVQAQQSAIYSQYLFNGLAINPAYAGHDEVLSLTFLSRFQSVGLDGAPNTQTFSAHTPVKKDKIGLGLQLFHETIGITKQSGAYFSYSYRIKYEDYTISFGLQGGANFYNSAYTTLLINDPNDPVFNSDLRAVTPNFGGGLYINRDKMFAGLSMPQMLPSTDRDVIQEKPIFIYGGYVFELASFLKLRPSTLAKIVNGKSVEWDISASLLFYEVLWVGLAFRPANAASFLVQLQASEQLQIGYAYDRTLNKLKSVASGSHEIMINYRFQYSQKGMMSPRYF